MRMRTRVQDVDGAHERATAGRMCRGGHAPLSFSEFGPNPISETAASAACRRKGVITIDTVIRNHRTAEGQNGVAPESLYRQPVAVGPLRGTAGLLARFEPPGRFRAGDLRLKAEVGSGSRREEGPFKSEVRSAKPEVELRRANLGGRSDGENRPWPPLQVVRLEHRDAGNRIELRVSRDQKVHAAPQSNRQVQRVIGQQVVRSLEFHRLGEVRVLHGQRRRFCVNGHPRPGSTSTVL